MNTKPTNTAVLALCVLACAASADMVVIAPGDGVETNVTEQLTGAGGVQVNDGHSGGGIVRLSNDWNMYSGDTHVKCGTLEATVVRDSYKPSSLGRNAISAQTLYVGNGTFRYSGPSSTSSRRLVLDVTGERHAAVLDVASDLSFTGGAWSESGTLLKTGAGTLTLEQPDGIYRLTTRGNGFEEFYPTAFNGNGDSPSSIYESASLTVLEGRLAIKGSDAVTNLFGTLCAEKVTDASAGVTYIGRALADGTERSAHLDIYGGYNHFGEYIRFDGYNGFTRTNNSSLNVYGGTVAARFVEVGDAKEMNVATCPELNVYEGGAAKIGYLHLSRSKGSKGRVSVYGGRIDAVGAMYVAFDNGGESWNDPLLPTAHVTVASNGWLVGSLTVGEYSDLTLRLASGGTYQFWSLNDKGRVVVEGDGGTFRQTSPEATFQNTTLRIGAGGLTLYGNTMTFPGVVENDPSADEIGTLIVDCGAAKLLGSVDFTGEIAVNDNRSLVLSGDVAASKITLDAGTLSADSDATVKHLAHGVGKVSTLAFDVSDGTAKKLNIEAWDVPNSVNVTLSGAVSGATYDLMTVPADCGASASTFVAKSVNDSLTATFSVEMSGGNAIVRATVGPAAAALADGGSRTWGNANGGEWATDSNWTEGSAPADGARTAVSFPTASAGEKATVSLNKGVALSGLAFDSAPGYKVTGSGPMDVYKSGTAVVSSKSGTNAVDTAMTYSGSLRLASQLGSRLEMASLEGRGNVQLNDGSSGAATGLSGLGSVVIGSALVNGSLTERNGLLEVGTMGPGITALSIGYGLFRYTGGDYTLNGTLTASPNNWSQAQIEITDPESTFTVAGSVTQTEGGFTKRGKGTLVFDGDGEHLLSNISLHEYNFADSGYAGHDNVWGKNGLSPIEGSGQAQSFFGLSCAGGLMRWGKDGQILEVRGGDLVVGTTTTASPGCEYDAAAEINGGETIVTNGDIVVSRNHGNSKKGTAEKETLMAKLTVNDGYVKANNLYLTYNDWGLSKSDTRFEQNGGRIDVANVCVGHRDANSSSVSYVMNGGTLNATSWFKVAPEQGGSVGSVADMCVDINGGEVSVGGYFSFGYNSWGNPQMEVAISNATVRCAECLRAYCGAVTLNLNEGAVVCAKGIDVFGTYASNSHTLNFDGGRFRCTTSGFTFKDWLNLNIKEQGAYLDTSEMTSGCISFNNPIASAAGALHICGNDPMRCVQFASVDVGELDMMVEPGGSALAYLAYCASADVTVCNGGAFGSRWTSTSGAATQVTGLTLGTNANDRTMLYFTTGSGYITPVKVAGSLSVNGVVEIAVMNDGRTSYEAADFTSKTILIAPKGTINADVFGFTTLMPTVQATFTVTSYDEENDQLVMTTVVNQDGASFSTHTWTATAGGDWGSVSNWDSMPNDQMDSRIVFTESLQGHQTVSLGGARTIGSMASSADNVTLADGSLSFSTTSGGTVETTRGTLTLPAVSVDGNGLTLATAAGSTQIVSQAISTPSSATAVVINPVSGSGTVRLAAPQNGQSFSLSSGTIEGPASSFDGGSISVTEATLHVTEGGFVKSPVTGLGEGMVLRTDSDTWFESDVSSTRTFVKAGPGAAYLSGSGSVQLGARNWDQASDAPADSLPVNGDLPATKDENTCFVNAGSLVFGLNPSQSVSIPNGHILIGSRFVEFDSNGDIIQPTLEIYGGTVKLPNIRMGADLGSYRLISGNEAKIVRPTMNVYGGDITFAGCYIGVADGNVNSVNTLNLYGGTMTSSDQWITFGFGRTTYRPDCGQAKSIVNIYGGLLKLENTASNVGEISKTGGDTDINLYGGEMSYAGRCFVTAAHEDAKVNINLAGGTLSATELTCNDNFATGGEGYRNLRWDGGTFKPTEDGKSLAENWTANVVAAGGAKFDLSAIPDGAYILNKPFTHDSECEGEDGGIELTAGGTLILNAANEMKGPVIVRGGVVIPNLQEAVSGGIVLAGGSFDCNEYEFQVPYLKGSGGEIANGSVTVLGMLAPLDSAPTNAPYATIESMDLLDGSVVKCPIRETEEGWIAPYFRVTSSCTGRIVLDFGLDGDVSLPSDFRVKVAEHTSNVTSFPAVTGINFGISRGRTFGKETSTDSETGITSVYAVLRPMGTVVVFR